MKYIEVKVKHGSKEITQNVRVPENAKEGEHLVYSQEVLEALAADKKNDKKLPPYFLQIVKSHRAKKEADEQNRLEQEDQLLAGDETAEGESDETNATDNLEGGTESESENSGEENLETSTEGEDEAETESEADEDVDSGESEGEAVAGDDEDSEATKKTASKKKKKKNKRG